jgi:Protein of unknown function (DUF2628)
MAVYSVFEPPERGNDAVGHAEQFAFVRDGFSFPAFFFGPIWMAWHQLWLVLIAYLGLIIALALGMWAFAASGDVRALTGLLVSLLIGLEAASLQRWTLMRQGFHDRGIVVADDPEAAERRFFAAWLPQQVRYSVPPSAPRLRTLPGPEVVGLFPTPGAKT